MALLAVTATVPAGAHVPSVNGSLLADDRVLLAPELGDFASAIRNAGLAPDLRIPPRRAPADALDADVADLAAALEERGTPRDEASRLTAAYRALRAAMTKRAAEQAEGGARPVTTPIEDPPIPAGLPREFDAYVRGALAWHRGDVASARAAWNRLMALPENERRRRSTWAAYMLGRAARPTDPGLAAIQFRFVRTLAAQGFRDALDLAGASYGEEARARLENGRVVDAIGLYAALFVAGDRTALDSLRVAAGRAWAGPDDALRACARNGVARRVLLAHLVAWPPYGSDRANVFLRELEQAGVTDLREAEPAGAAAYNAARFDLAARWLARAPEDSPRANWYRAKLALRDGALDRGAALLEKASAGMPPAWVPPRPLDVDPPEGADFWCGYHPGCRSVAPAQELAAQLGVLRAARGEYAAALDALLRSGFWVDAAYLGEQVLTPDELKAYVDANWPEGGPVVHPDVGERWNALAVSPIWITRDNVAGALRHLLGRRLVRLGRFDEARPYLPAEVRPHLDRYVAALAAGPDPAQPPEARARALWTAAQDLRRHGTGLLGTEADPDWMMMEGDFEACPLWFLRGADAGYVPSRIWETPCERGTHSVAKPREDELARALAHRAAPARRFHYRYVACELAWEAAALLPDGSDETAEVLRTAGTWLGARDPEYAERFYKALVRRCGKTRLGREAARIRWFPPR